MNSEQEILFDAITDWKSNDDWQFADKEAAWKFFFQAGAASRDAEIAELHAEIDGLKEADAFLMKQMERDTQSLSIWDAGNRVCLEAELNEGEKK